MQGSIPVGMITLPEAVELYHEHWLGRPIDRRGSHGKKWLWAVEVKLSRAFWRGKVGVEVKNASGRHDRLSAKGWDPDGFGILLLSGEPIHSNSCWEEWEGSVPFVDPVKFAAFLDAHVSSAARRSKSSTKVTDAEEAARGAASGGPIKRHRGRPKGAGAHNYDAVIELVHAGIQDRTYSSVHNAAMQLAPDYWQEVKASSETAFVRRLAKKYSEHFAQISANKRN